MSRPKNIVAFDVETTGKNPTSDQVIELSIIRITGDGVSSTGDNILHTGDGDGGTNPGDYFGRFRPSVSVTPGAFAVHGISDDALAGAPTFAEEADTIRRLLLSADVLVGYNVSFDIRFLEAEFGRLEQKLDLWSKLVVDPLRIWHAMEPRKLENAFGRFVGGSFEAAHSAEADTRAVLDVLDGMKRSFDLVGKSWDDLAAMTAPDRLLWVGPSSHFKWEAGHVVFGFGKYESHPLIRVAAEDPKYLTWLQGAEFPSHAQNLCKGALSGIAADQFHDRVAGHFGKPDREEPDGDIPPAPEAEVQSQLA